MRTDTNLTLLKTKILAAKSKLPKGRKGKQAVSTPSNKNYYSKTNPKSSIKNTMAIYYLKQGEK
jgi:hypothetical protein